MTTSSLNSGKEIIALVDAQRYVPIQEVKVGLNYAVRINGHITAAATLHGQPFGGQRRLLLALEEPECPSVVQRPFFAPVEIASEGSRSVFRPPAKSDRLEVRISDRHHLGIMTGIISDY